VGFWGLKTPKIRLDAYRICGGSNRLGNSLFDVSTTAIRPYLLGLKEKKGDKPKVYISPYCPNDPSQPIMTKVGKTGDMDELIKRAKFGVDRLSSAGSVGS
jgi:hypothetical protein